MVSLCIVSLLWSMCSHSLQLRICVAGYWCVLLINFSFWCSFWLHALHCPNTKIISYFFRFCFVSAFAKDFILFFQMYRNIDSNCTELHKILLQQKKTFVHNYWYSVSIFDRNYFLLWFRLQSVFFLIFL